MVSSVSAGTPRTDAKSKAGHIDDVHDLVERVNILGVCDWDFRTPSGKAIDVNKDGCAALRGHELLVNVVFRKLDWNKCVCHIHGVVKLRRVSVYLVSNNRLTKGLFQPKARNARSVVRQHIMQNLCVHVAVSVLDRIAVQPVHGGNDVLPVVGDFFRGLFALAGAGQFSDGAGVHLV